MRACLLEVYQNKTLQNKLLYSCGFEQILTLLCTSTGSPSGFNSLSKLKTQNKTGKTGPK